MLDDIPLSTLFGVLILLIFISAFFSGSETGLLTINRYRLKHLKNKGLSGAVRASKLLERPDRLIGIILLGNNFVNILASAIATVIAIRLWGENGIMVATLLLTIVILLFAEVAPKTVAALHPEKLAFPASYILGPLLKVFYPIVWLINSVANGLLRLLGIKAEGGPNHILSRDELRTVVDEAGENIPQSHQKMLLNIFDLETASVEEIMIPRNEIIGINLEESIDEIVKQILSSQHTRLPVFHGDIDNTLGVLHLRHYLALQKQKEVSKEDIQQIMKEIYYIPEATPLNTQLLNFQKERRRIGLVVDEYGDIQGMVTIDDILEEIVGEFTTDPSDSHKEIHPQEDGSYLIDGSLSIRELNRLFNWELATDGPKTVNGMVIEYLETIPEAGTSLLIDSHPIEVIQTTSSSIKIVRIDPRLKKGGEKEHNDEKITIIRD
ncbi:MAG: HlyC/CorC family transporter [Chromatiales bacterium]|nr:HlyC/CorC family transporter [Chromatiales bacterium]